MLSLSYFGIHDYDKGCCDEYNHLLLRSGTGFLHFWPLTKIFKRLLDCWPLTNKYLLLASDRAFSSLASNKKTIYHSRLTKDSFIIGVWQKDTYIYIYICI